MGAPNPVPARFDLPTSRWRYADDEERRAAGAGFLALREGVVGPFTPNVTVTSEMRLDCVDPAEVGDTAAAQLSGTITNRRTAGGDTAPGLTQRVDFALDTPDGRLGLVQIQVVLTARDEHRSEPGALVYLLALTALPAQVGEVLEDFQALVASFRIGDPDRFEAS